MEQAAAAFFQGRITEDQFRGQHKAEAKRPIDGARLDAFHHAQQERLSAYRRMRRTVIAVATDPGESEGWPRRKQAGRVTTPSVQVAAETAPGVGKPKPKAPVNPRWPKADSPATCVFAPPHARGGGGGGGQRVGLSGGSSRTLCCARGGVCC